MDFLPNLLPAVPPLELDPTSPYQNVTFLQNSFIATFLASLVATTIRIILGESARLCHLIQHVFIQVNASDKTINWSEE